MTIDLSKDHLSEIEASVLAKLIQSLSTENPKLRKRSVYVVRDSTNSLEVTLSHSILKFTRTLGASPRQEGLAELSEDELNYDSDVSYEDPHELSSYRIVEDFIGNGSYGNVKSSSREIVVEDNIAHVQKSEQARAIKRMNTDKEDRMSFMSHQIERNLTARIYPETYDLTWREKNAKGEEKDYLDMEMKGRYDLLKYLRRFKLTEQQRLHICLEILKALQSIHQKKILHLDLKLNNIRIDPTSGKLWIIDFGLSCNGTNHTVKAPIGTDYYMAPELQTATSSKPVTISTKTDYYSLGLNLCDILFGIDSREDNKSKPSMKGYSDIKNINTVYRRLEELMNPTVAKRSENLDASISTFKSLLEGYEWTIPQESTGKDEATKQAQEAIMPSLEEGEDSLAVNLRVASVEEKTINYYRGFEIFKKGLRDFTAGRLPEGIFASSVETLQTMAIDVEFESEKPSENPEFISLLKKLFNLSELRDLTHIADSAKKEHKPKLTSFAEAGRKALDECYKDAVSTNKLIAIRGNFKLEKKRELRYDFNNYVVTNLCDVIEMQSKVYSNAQNAEAADPHKKTMITEANAQELLMSIRHHILDTPWQVGLFGGQTIHIEKDNYNHSKTKRIPNTMIRVLDRIKKAEKTNSDSQGKDAWRQALQDVSKMTAEQGCNTTAQQNKVSKISQYLCFFGGRSKETQEVYNKLAEASKIITEACAPAA